MYEKDIDIPRNNSNVLVSALVWISPTVLFVAVLSLVPSGWFYGSTEDSGYKSACGRQRLYGKSLSVPLPARKEELSLPVVSEERNREIRDKWGVEVVRLFPTAAGQMLDFRYRVVNPEKAGCLFDRDVKPRLVDEATGREYPVPRPPKTGSLKPKNDTAVKGRTYFIIFANPGGALKSGDKATIKIGKCVLEHLSVR